MQYIVQTECDEFFENGELREKGVLDSEIFDNFNKANKQYKYFLNRIGECVYTTCDTTFILKNVLMEEYSED